VPVNRLPSLTLPRCCRVREGSFLGNDFPPIPKKTKILWFFVVLRGFIKTGTYKKVPMKKTFFLVAISCIYAFVALTSPVKAQTLPPYPGARSDQAMADAIRVSAKSTISSLKSLAERSQQIATTDEARKEAEVQIRDAERALRIFDQMKVNVYLTDDSIDKVKSFYEEKWKVTFKDEARSLEELANGLKLSGFDKVNPEDFKSMTIRRLLYLNKKERLELSINDKGVDPITGKMVQKTVINFIVYPK
jgi:hypothetical protein